MAVDGTVALTTNGNGAATIVNDAGLNFTTSTVDWCIERNSHDWRYNG